MNHIENGENKQKPRILVAPLDWGLGHATRCVPIIQELLKQDCDVVLAGEGMQASLLKNEFPQLAFLSLPGYRIKYPVSGKNMMWKMIWQLPGLNDAIKEEHEWLKQKVKEWKFDAIISDNRYGLYHKKIPAVIITHQLQIKSPWKWTTFLLRKIMYRYINRFTECWIPDNEGQENLAGELAHPSAMPLIPVYYIGALSRLKKTGIAEKKNHLLVMLSGPEPQRSIFETIIIRQISQYNGTATVLRGLPSALSIIPSTNSIYFYNHLSSKELNEEMQKAELVIARSGYSSIMDAMSLQKKCILVPTPGQPEQEYLAAYLSEKNIALAMQQTNFSLADALLQASVFGYRQTDASPGSTVQKTILRFISLLSDAHRKTTNLPNV
jgi:uncharacterized protein (TIGR00661 family)